jgi:photosystem II stability/assembly factor-like uncharacterized protein
LDSKLFIYFSASLRSLLPFVLILLISSSFLGCTRGEPTIFSIAIHPHKHKIIYVSTKRTVFKTRDGGRSWSPMGEGLESAQVISLGIDPKLSSTIYAGTFATAVYKSVDGGQLWRPANIGLKGHVSVVTTLAIHPQNPNTVYIGTTIGPYRSTNAGGSWEEIVHGMESVYTVSLAIDPQDPRTLYAGTSGGMYKSTNGGNRWEIINEGLIEEEVDSAMALGVNTIAIDPLQTENLFIGTTRGIFYTADGGKQWTPMNKGLDTKFVNQVLIDPKKPNVLYAGTEKGVYKSTDRAGSWKAMNNGLINLVVRSMVFHPFDPDTTLAGTQGGLFKTTDGAETWNLLAIRGT